MAQGDVKVNLERNAEDKKILEIIIKFNNNNHNNINNINCKKNQVN